MTQQEQQLLNPRGTVSGHSPSAARYPLVGLRWLRMTRRRCNIRAGQPGFRAHGRIRTCGLLLRSQNAPNAVLTSENTGHARASGCTLVRRSLRGVSEQPRRTVCGHQDVRRARALPAQGRPWTCAIGTRGRAACGRQGRLQAAVPRADGFVAITVISVPRVACPSAVTRCTTRSGEGQFVERAAQPPVTGNASGRFG